MNPNPFINTDQPLDGDDEFFLSLLQALTDADRAEKAVPDSETDAVNRALDAVVHAEDAIIAYINLRVSLAVNRALQAPAVPPLELSKAA